MTATSQKINRICRNTLTAFAVLVALGSATSAFAVAGAIYTTTSTGTKVNANLYELKADVYLNGGPQNQNDPGLVPDGTYYFQVTVPGWHATQTDLTDGLLSEDCALCRQVTVFHGRIVGSTGPACKHAEGTFNPDNKQTPVQLIPYSDTDNPGGEYKAWLIPVSAATIDTTDCRVLIFSESDSKTDNFKVAENATGKGACCLPDGSCAPGISSADCLAQGGTYQGDDTTCDPNPCPPTGCVCTLSFSNCPDDKEVQCYGDVPAAVNPTASVLCEGGVEHAVDVTYEGQTESNEGSSCNNTITRIWTATDDCKSTYTCSQVIVVNDTTGPTLTCPKDPITVSTCAPAKCATATFTVTATDNCGGKTTIVCTNQNGDVVISGGCFPVGTTTVTCTATDDCKNSSDCNFTITVNSYICGGLTMGFWQNKNGQGIISNCSGTGLRTFLRGFRPFQDLSSTATPAQVATYVYNTIKAANASGASMNAMLKAQMLATALDVYFSSAAGGNKINAPTPIGGLSVDLTKVCKMIDSTGGTATCSGTYLNSSGAFGGATCKTVSDMLVCASNQATAATTANPLASPWYGQVKSTQEQAKNAFDAINNGVALACP